MKKILEITGEPIGHGGQEMFIINLLNNIDKNGLSIDLLTPYSCLNEAYKDQVNKSGGEVFCFDLPFVPNGNRFNIIKPLYKFLKSSNYDVVHIHSGSITVLAICSMIAKLSRISKIIVHSHSGGYKKKWSYYLLKIFSYPFLKICPTDYCACSELAGKWKFPYSVVKFNLKIINNGVDIQKFIPNSEIRNKYRNKLGISPNTLLIGHVGRFSYQKNQEFLISVLEMLKKDVFQVKLIFIGEGENLIDVKELVKSKRLENDIIFAGVCSNVNDYMQAMDIFALPSRWEGLPIVGIEAQAAGLPVILSEYITSETKISDNVKYLSLNVMDWVKYIENLKGSLKINNTDRMKACGYDINMTAGILRNIYMS